jgi:hypothetical protein
MTIGQEEVAAIGHRPAQDVQRRRGAGGDARNWHRGATRDQALERRIVARGAEMSLYRRQDLTDLQLVLSSERRSVLATMSSTRGGVLNTMVGQCVAEIGCHAGRPR